MPSLERVELSSLRADPNNPRSKFEGLDQLAESFRYTPDRPGEPFTPLIVVRDGNVFRIIDGERRFRAMQQAGEVESCLCSVFEDADDAYSMAAMLATDNKDPLKPEDKARGLQMMLILGVDEDAADAVGRFERGTAARVRRVIGKAEKPAPLDLGTLLRVSDVDDEAKRDELLALADGGTGWDSEFDKVLSAVRSRQEAKRKTENLVQAAHDAGFELEDEEPGDGWMCTGRVWAYDIQDGSTGKLEGLGGYARLWLEPSKENEWSPGRVSCTEPILRVFVPCAEEDPEAAAADAERRERKERIEEAVCNGEDARKQWLVEQFVGDAVAGFGRYAPIRIDPRLERIRDWLWTEFEENVEYDEDVFGCQLQPEFPDLLLALVWGNLWFDGVYVAEDALAVLDGNPSQFARIRVQGYIDQADRFAEAGFELSAEEIELIDSLAAALDGCSDGPE